MNKLSICLIIISIFAVIGSVYADDPGSWGGYNYCPYCGNDIGPHGVYGMGPGMMGGQGMGPGMMGRGYQGQSPECQKFYDETAGLRKELHNKEFEYFEAARNPKTTGEALMKIEKEVREFQEKIYAKGPIGCWQ